jgi:hypothetical protein
MVRFGWVGGRVGGWVRESKLGLRFQKYIKYYCNKNKIVDLENIFRLSSIFFVYVVKKSLSIFGSFNPRIFSRGFVILNFFGTFQTLESQHQNLRESLTL